eukprot:jgi/Undpi1/9177/HiC_scaffold_26.g11635.m1
MITWLFAVSAAADDAWLSFYGVSGLELGLDCVYNTTICRLYDGATAFQFLATTIISLVLVLVVVAACSLPPTTAVLGRALGAMLAVFTIFQMIAFALMADVVAEFDDTNIKAGPTLGVAVMAWLFGLVGTITIMYLNSRVTSAHEGPLRQFMSRGGGVARGASAEQQVGTV